ncbi:MAG: VCBS repeat-containing protein, partial [Myxococcales bacterium]|nr:VCBS repeat-containing protein [Myxococcales bacterium]
MGDVGDINGDGRSELVVGGTRGNQGVSGYARIFSGMDGSILYEFTGAANDDEFGRACAGVGDVNKDGVPDIIVGAIQRNTGGGYARVFSGADGAVLYTFFGQVATDRFGNSVDGVGDMDGDGYADVVVGAPSPDPVFPVAGAKAREKSGLPGYARVFSGRTGEILMEVSTTASKDGLGVSVSGAGDLNGDAVPDFIAGAWQDQNGLPGFARVYAGERPAPPGCAPVNVTTSALGVAAFAA